MQGLGQAAENRNWFDGDEDLGYFGGRTMRENKLGGITFVDGKCRFWFMELFGVCNKLHTLPGRTVMKAIVKKV